MYSILNQPHTHRRRVTTPAQDLHSQHLNVRGGLRSVPQTAAATIGLHNQRISARTARNHLGEAHLAHRLPHRGSDLTAAQLKWANARIQLCLELWRGVLFADESRLARCGQAGVCYEHRTDVHFIQRTILSCHSPMISLCIMMMPHCCTGLHTIPGR